MTLGETHNEVANHACDIENLFKPGAKVTILVRNPSRVDGDMVVTNDQMDEAIKALTHLKEKDQRRLTLEDALGLR